MKATVLHLYRVARGEDYVWRWQMRDRRNNKIIAASSESYARRIDAVRNLKRIVNVLFAPQVLSRLRGRGEVFEVIE